MNKKNKIAIKVEEKFYEQKIKTVYVKGRGLQDVFTPRQLIDKVIKKLKGEINSFDNLEFAALFNIGFVFSLVKFGAKPENIWFFCDSDEKEYLIKKMYNNRINIVRIYYSKEWGIEFMPKIKKQFNVIVMNPPYQAPQTIRNDKGITGGGTTLWDKFLDRAIDLLTDDGYIASINPSGWRQPQHFLWAKIRSGIKYLEIHPDKDGKRIFDKDTRFDVIVFSKKNSTRTTIVDETGKKTDINIGDWPFLPNYAFEIFDKIIAREGEEKCEVLYSSSDYETRKPWMSKEKTEKFKYPCIYMINSKNEPILFYSSKRNAHFDVPKVIFGSGRSTGFILDSSGKYGLTQFARGIVDSKSNLPKIYKALSSDKFKRFRTALFIAQTEINKDALACLRKDFWKEFI